MTAAHAAKAKSDKMSPEDINESADVLGKQIWRIVPYAKKYPKRVFAGVFANAAARFFDLMPFVAIGLAVDYFTTDMLSGPQIIQDMVTTIHSDPAVGYGVLIFLGFLCSGDFPRHFGILLANPRLQHSTRSSHGRHAVAHRHGGLLLRPSTNRPDHVGAVKRRQST